MAFIMLTAVVAATMAAVAVAMRGDQQATFVTLGTTLARSKLAAAGIDYPLEPGVTTGRFPNGYRWRADVRRDRVIASGNARPIAGYRVEVTVSERGSGRGRALSLASVEIVR